MSALGRGTLQRRDAYVVLFALLALTALAWIYLAWLTHHDSMAGMAMDGMGAMHPAAVSWGTELFLAFIMWTVMMIGMMTPSVVPVILLYARVGRHAAANGKPFAATGWFTGGYFLAWTGFSVLAALAQILLRDAALLTPAMASANRFLAGDILIIAGLYQWSRLKDACLTQCLSPLPFIQRHGGFKADERQW